MKPGPRITLITCGLIGFAFTGPMLIAWIVRPALLDFTSMVVGLGLPLAFLVAIAIGAFARKDDAISICPDTLRRPPRK